MKLTTEQSQKLLRERGIWATEACDKFGQVLGAVRYMRRGEAGQWCSELCRDGQAIGDVRQQRRQAKGGRPAKYRNTATRTRVQRAQSAVRSRVYKERQRVTA